MMGSAPIRKKTRTVPWFKLYMVKATGEFTAGCAQICQRRLPWYHGRMCSNSAEVPHLQHLVLAYGQQCGRGRTQRGNRARAPSCRQRIGCRLCRTSGSLLLGRLQGHQSACVQMRGERDQWISAQSKTSLSWKQGTRVVFIHSWVPLLQAFAPSTNTCLRHACCNTYLAGSTADRLWVWKVLIWFWLHAEPERGLHHARELVVADVVSILYRHDAHEEVSRVCSVAPWAHLQGW